MVAMGFRRSNCRDTGGRGGEVEEALTEGREASR